MIYPLLAGILTGALLIGEPYFAITAFLVMLAVFVMEPLW